MNNTPPELVITGHHGPVTALAFSADGNTLVSGSYDQTAILWDVATGVMRRCWRLTASINGCVLTPDGKRVVTEDGQVWDTATGQLMRRARRYRYLAPLACSPDGKLLASSTLNPEGEGGYILLSDMATGRKKGMFRCSEFQPMALAFSSDGCLVGATGAAKQEEDRFVAVMTLYDVKTGQVRQTLPQHDLAYLASVALLPQTRLVGITSDCKQLWDAEAGHLLYTIRLEDPRGFPDGIKSARLSPDGRLIAVGRISGQLSVYEVASSRLLWQTQAHQSWLRAIAFTADAQRLASAGEDYSIRLWEATTGACIRTLGRSRVPVEAVAFSPEGEAITAVSVDGTACYWSLQTARCERQEANFPGVLRLGAPKNSDTARNLWTLSPARLPAREERKAATWKDRPRKPLRTVVASYPGNRDLTQIEAVIAAISPDGSLLALYGQGDDTAPLRIWNLAAQTVQCTMEDTSSPRGAITFSHDNRLLAFGGEANQIKLHDTHTGRVVRQWTIAQETMWSLRELIFSPDGRTLASYGEHGIIVWDVATGNVLQVVATHDGSCSLAFSADSNTLAAGINHSGVVYLKSLKDGGIEGELCGHTADIDSVTFSPDGILVATGSQDGTVKLWEAASGTLLATFLALPDREWIIYTPEGHYNCSAGAEQYILWKIGDDLLPASAFSNTYRSLEKLSLGPPVAVAKKVFSPQRH